MAIARAESHAEFGEAFYAGGPFKVERFLLPVFVSRQLTDLQALQPAVGELDECVEWRVEAGTIFCCVAALVKIGLAGTEST